jgi:hypothetical protein
VQNTDSKKRGLKPTLRARSTRGQSMVEYTWVAHAVVFAGATGLLPVMMEVYKALNKFYDSLYFVLQSSV